MKKKLILPITVVLFSLFFSAKAQDGPTIFAAKCAACHSIGNGRLVGPDLKGVDTKYNSSYLVKWIRSSQAVINSGDAKAKALFLEYNSIVMPDFMDLKDTDIKAIVGYIKSQSSKQQAVTAKKPQPQTKPKTQKP